MRYLSVCSGIEAATVAWHPLGWTPVGFSEIEAFPSAVLAHHYPDIPNYGDMTQHEQWPITRGAVDLLVGGTPCQSFSVAGLRKGLADPRGNLALTYLAIADRLRPKWVVWENVPGVLSSSGGRDFGAFLGALVKLGYGFAYRVLDAQWFGVAQRRRRVFLVGHASDWRRAAAVLFERESLRGHPAPSREAWKAVAADAQTCARGSSWWDGTDCAGTLTKEGAGGNQRMPDKDNFGAVLSPVVIDRAAFNQGKNAQYEPRIKESQTMDSLIARGPHAIAHPVPYDLFQITAPVNRQNRKPGDPCHTLARDNAAHAAVAFHPTQDPISSTEVCHSISSGNGQGCATAAVCVTGDRTHALTTRCAAAEEDGTGRGVPLVPSAMAVRRLTPVECERLQGFPDGYTAIPWRGKPASECPDGPRYRALGNSMAVPCMRWIGERIAAQEVAQ